MPRKLLLFLCIPLLLGAGCSGLSTDSTSQTPPPAGTFQGLGSLGNGARQIILVKSECDVSEYTEGATVLREKNVGDYTVSIVQYGDIDAPDTDDCVEMSFAAREVRKLRQMMTLLQEELQSDLEESEVSVSLQDDLPGSCDEVAQQIADRYPQAAERIRARCEQLKEQQQQEQEQGENEELQYDNDDAQCSVRPATGCSPSMSAAEYVTFSMDYFTPSNQVVQAEAARYSDIDSMYVAMQHRPWQSDSSIFGCSDKFQEPEYYFGTAPQLDTSMMCGMSVGDCDDKANAFGSILVASGLFGADEVRTALGTVKFGNRPSDIGGHAWTEVYLADEGHWIPVDAVMGNTCYDSGSCTSYNESDFIDWDYFNYVEYPVLEYWGWSNDTKYYIPSTKEASAGLPAYWKEEAKTVYEAL